jgi:hypothetical protein
MIPYTVKQIIKIFTGCKTATSLLETREELEISQPFSETIAGFYNCKMSSLLKQNAI